MVETQDIELSVVILCYKAKNYVNDFVHQILSELEPLGITYEIVLVANYDKLIKDDTPRIAKKIADKNPKVKVVAKEKEGRMGWDMRSGFEATSGKYIVVIDGDGQMPASDIPAVFGVIKYGNYDLVKTYRAKRYDGFVRAIMSSVYNNIFRLLYHPSFPIKDVNAKPKIFTREAYNRMNLISSDWFTDAEIMIEAIQMQMKICQISTVFFKHERRKSFVGWSTAVEFIYNLFKYKFINKNKKRLSS